MKKPNTDPFKLWERILKIFNEDENPDVFFPCIAKVLLSLDLQSLRKHLKVVYDGCTKVEEVDKFLQKCQTLLDFEQFSQTVSLFCLLNLIIVWFFSSGNPESM